MDKSILIVYDDHYQAKTLADIFRQKDEQEKKQLRAIEPDNIIIETYLLRP